MNYELISMLIFITIADWIFYFSIRTLDKIIEELTKEKIVKDILRDKIIKFYDRALLITLIVFAFNIGFIIYLVKTLYP